MQFTTVVKIESAEDPFEAFCKAKKLMAKHQLCAPTNAAVPANFEAQDITDLLQDLLDGSRDSICIRRIPTHFESPPIGKYYSLEGLAAASPFIEWTSDKRALLYVNADGRWGHVLPDTALQKPFTIGAQSRRIVRVKDVLAERADRGSLSHYRLSGKIKDYGVKCIAAYKKGEVLANRNKFYAQVLRDAGAIIYKKTAEVNSFDKDHYSIVDGSKAHSGRSLLYDEDALASAHLFRLLQFPFFAVVSDCEGWRQQQDDVDSPAIFGTHMSAYFNHVAQQIVTNDDAWLVNFSVTDYCLPFVPMRLRV